MVAVTLSISARSGAVTPPRAYSPVMPRPMSAGVLGMLRTMRSLPSQRAMLALGMPAATLRCRAPGHMGADRQGGLLEGLRLDGPDHQVDTLQEITGLLMGDDIELVQQQLPGFGKGFDHLDLVGRRDPA